MNITLNTEFSDKYEDLEIIIHANALNNQVQNIIEILQNLNLQPIKIIGKQNGNNFLLNEDDIICFYSENKSNYCRTNSGIFKINETLYNLESKLTSNNFIRISNSCIANINKIDCFNTEITGTIKVNFKDGSIDYVSRRRINTVLKKLKGES